MTIGSEEYAQRGTTPAAEATEKGKGAVQHELVEDISAQDKEINHFINEISEANKEDEDPPLQSLKRKPRYKHIAKKLIIGNKVPQLSSAKHVNIGVFFYPLLLK